MRSAFYRTSLWHSRLVPRVHSFKYRMNLLYADLDELPQLFRKRLFWSFERANLVSFRRSDYLGPTEKPLREAVLDRVEAKLGRRPTGSIGILTQPRTLGYVFNPVSFYFCHDVGGRLDVIVAEITNTPWSERHAYILDASGQLEDELVFRFNKDFHVSPFFDLDQVYEWRFTTPGQRLSVSMTNFERGQAVFRSELTAERRPINGRSLAAALLFAPLQPLRLHLAIYWQAARLHLKRTPFFTHPKKRTAVQDVQQS